MNKSKTERATNISYDDFWREQMKDPEFKREYDALETEFSIRRQLIDLRLKRGWSQTELAAKVGTPRPSISRVEARGVKDLDFARRLAEALDCRLEVRFVPKTGTFPKTGTLPKTGTFPKTGTLPKTGTFPKEASATHVARKRTVSANAKRAGRK